MGHNKAQLYKNVVKAGKTGIKSIGDAKFKVVCDSNNLNMEMNNLTGQNKKLFMSCSNS